MFYYSIVIIRKKLPGFPEGPIGPAGPLSPPGPLFPSSPGVPRGPSGPTSPFSPVSPESPENNIVINYCYVNAYTVIRSRNSNNYQYQENIQSIFSKKWKFFMKCFMLYTICIVIRSRF